MNDLIIECADCGSIVDEDLGGCDRCDPDQSVVPEDIARVAGVLNSHRLDNLDRQERQRLAVRAAGAHHPTGLERPMNRTNTTAAETKRHIIAVLGARPLESTRIRQHADRMDAHGDSDGAYRLRRLARDNDDGERT